MHGININVFAYNILQFNIEKPILDSIRQLNRLLIDISRFVN